jgi:hypothetical protein
MRRKSGLSDVKLLVICGVVMFIIGVLLVPGFFVSGRASNERNFTTSLKTLASAEADFRTNDRDWNHVNDFWTADVKGLYTLTSVAAPGSTPNSTTDPSIKLIELSVARADADDTFYSADGENVPLREFALPTAKAGYWYAALRSDLSSTPPTTYAQTVRHRSKFGFLGFPDSPSEGKYVGIVNESNTLYRAAAMTPLRTSHSNPPGLAGIPAAFLNWPDEKTLKARWDRLE